MPPDSSDDFDLLSGAGLELTDLLNSALDKGVILHGDVTLAVADVDLIKLNVGLLLSALATIESRPAVNRPALANIFGPISFDPSREAGRVPVLPVSGDAGVDGGEIPSPGYSSARSGAQGGESPSSAASLNAVARALPERINADVAGPESGLARLVLTLIEVLRKVLEHQAIRRMDGGKLSPPEIERLGLALSRLNDRMDDLKRIFNLTDEDLQIDLGPLGHLR